MFERVIYNVIIVMCKRLNDTYYLGICPLTFFLYSLYLSALVLRDSSSDTWLGGLLTCCRDAAKAFTLIKFTDDPIALSWNTKHQN